MVRRGTVIIISVFDALKQFSRDEGVRESTWTSKYLADRKMR